MVPECTYSYHKCELSLEANFTLAHKPLAHKHNPWHTSKIGSAEQKSFSSYLTEYRMSGGFQGTEEAALNKPI